MIKLELTAISTKSSLTTLISIETLLIRWRLSIRICDTGKLVMEVSNGIRFLYIKKIVELIHHHLVKGFDYKQFRAKK